MRIEKEKFNKLKQLDRIEFRQKLILINDLGNDSFKYFFTALVFSVFAVIFISTFTIFIAFVFFVLGIVQFLLCLKARGELMNDYFKIEVKK